MLKLFYQCVDSTAWSFWRILEPFHYFNLIIPLFLTFTFFFISFRHTTSNNIQYHRIFPCRKCLANLGWEYEISVIQPNRKETYKINYVVTPVNSAICNTMSALPFYDSVHSHFFQHIFKTDKTHFRTHSWFVKM